MFCNCGPQEISIGGGGSVDKTKQTILNCPRIRTPISRVSKNTNVRTRLKSLTLNARTSVRPPKTVRFSSRYGSVVQGSYQFETCEYKDFVVCQLTAQLKWRHQKWRRDEESEAAATAIRKQNGLTPGGRAVAALPSATENGKLTAPRMALYILRKLGSDQVIDR